MTDQFIRPASTLLVIAGLCWAAVVTFPLIFGRAAADPARRLPGAAACIGAPLVLVAAGFWLSDPRNGWWLLAVFGAVTGLCLLARRWFAGAIVPRAGRSSAAAALAAVTAGGVLVELGALMTVRLVVKPDPADSFLAPLRPERLIDGVRALGVPLLGVALAGLLLAGLASLGGAGSRWGSTVWTAATDDGIEPTGAGRRRLARRAVLVLMVVLIAVLFALPLAGGGGGAALTFASIATPEYGKLLFLAVVALLVARVSHWFDINRRPPLRRMWQAYRYVLFPLGVFCLVAIASGARHDFGTVVSVLAATVGVTWSATRFSMLRRPDAPEGGLRARTLRRLRRTWRAYRPFLGFGLVLLAVTAVVAVTMTDYAGERGKIWADPWQYRWDSGCVAAAPDTPGVPAAPDGWVPCLRSTAVDEESGRSQLARALSAVADGGVFGRGLADTASSVVPAGSTDFILVVIWHKLGALAVLLAAVLTVLLALALPRVARRPDVRPGAGPTPVELFAAGLGAMIAGQFLFVFAATVNVLPHSGVPAPLLSRGGQSNLALLVGVLVVLATGAALRRDAVPAAESLWTSDLAVTRPATASSAGRLGMLVPLAACLAIVAGVTFVPYWAPAPPALYGGSRPPCPARPADDAGKLVSAEPDPHECSTDRLAYRNTRIEIRFGDRPGLFLDRRQQTWQVIDDPALGGLTGADLAGLLRVGNGSAGMLELTDTNVGDDLYRDVLAGTAGTDLARRLALPGSPATADGWLTLTLDPRLQHALAEAMRADAPDGTPPLAGGAVVLDAASGRVLAAVTAPWEVPPTQVKRDAAADSSAVQDFEDDHDECVAPPPGTPSGGGCWHWSMQRPGATHDATGDAERRRYVPGDPQAALPEDRINRALGGRYGLGETMMVVIAAAYLDQPGTAATDLIPGSGDCAGATGDKITLAKALEGSCATAMGALAQQVGWERIVAQAQRFGMATGDCAATPAWLVRPVAGSAGTCLPSQAGYFDTAQNASGGRGVVGTPLGVATVLASIANHGVTVQPSLVVSKTHPETGLTEPLPAGRPQRALAEHGATELSGALHETLPGDGGDRDAWLTRGTYERRPDETPQATTTPSGATAVGLAATPANGVYADRYTWLTGYLATAHGPVAFAVVLECRDDQGARRAKFVLDAISSTIGR